ncbi:MAG: hypothetical protein C7B46_17095 [Sulfobacillus benefaciens]|uniref:Uncharacterized protein n=1 Tax=Sulfobacillus benefaciens TaxID=453960 RepID=A0A2T2X9R6_9FIRM|nr:MAG: hypothetical protein C7B46_17095 [Sulfobacillus benefaciens]
MADDFSDFPEDDAILHCYGQRQPHDPVSLIGTPTALRALRQALDAALDGGLGLCNVWAADGEAYSVLVIPSGQTLPLPCSDCAPAVSPAEMGSGSVPDLPC